MKTSVCSPFLCVIAALFTASALSLSAQLVVTLNDGDTDSNTYSTIPDSVTLEVTSGSAVFSGLLFGDGDLIKDGSGTLTYSPISPFVGQTSVEAGTLSVGTGSDLGSGGINVNGGTLAVTGNLSMNGDVVVDSADASLTTGGYLEIGQSGTGSLTISDGGEVSTGSTTAFGVQAGSNGTGVITGTGSRLDVTSQLYIGYIGTGSLTVSDGGTVSASSVIFGSEGGDGTLNLNSGGTLQIGSGGIGSGNSGTATVNLGGGTIQATAFTASSIPIVLTSGTDSTFDSNGTLFFLGGSISGEGGFTKSGEGQLWLFMESNSYTGGTTVSAGTLTANYAEALPGDVVNNAVVEIASGTYSGTMSGSGSLTMSGSGTLILSQNNTYTGGTTISAGTLQLGSGGASGSVVGNITNNAALAFNRSGDNTYDGVISGSGSVSLDTGVLRLSQAQTYTGATSIGSGGYLVLPTGVDQGLSSSTTVAVASGGNFDISNRAQTISGLTGEGTVYSYGGSSGVLTVNTATGQSQTFSGVIGGPYNNFALAKSGDGTLTLTGTNSYNQGTTLTGGVLEVQSASNLGSGNITIDGGTLRWASGAAASFYSGFNAFGAGGATFDTNGNDITVTGTLSGSGGLNKTGSGTLALTNNNSYSGGTTVNEGTIEFSSTSNFGSGNITIDGGTLRWASGSTADFYSGFGAFGAGGATFDTNGNDVAIYAPLSGAGSLTKIGSGILTVTNANTYSGGTTVSAGTLLVNTASDLGTGSVDIGAGASLAAATHFEFHTDVTVDGADAVILSPNHFEVGSAGDGSLTLTNGARAGSGTTTTLAYYSDDTGTIDVSGSDSVLYAQSALRVGYGGTGTLTVESGGIANADSLILGSQSGSNGIINLNTGGVLQVGGTDGIQIGEGTGTFNLAGGTLRVGGDDRVAAPPESASLDLTELPATLAAAIAANIPQSGDTGLTTSVLMNLSNASTIDTNGSSATLSGTLSGAGTLTKSGTGTLSINGANTYSGNTTVNAGTLKVNNSSGSAFGTGNVTVASGGTLGGSGSFSGSLTVEEGGTLAPGNSPGTLETGSTTFEGGGIYHWEIDDAGGVAGTNWDLIIVNGTLTVNATSENPFIILIDGTNNPIDAANFDPYTNGYSFTLIETSGGIAFGTDASIGDSFTVDATAFVNPAGGGWTIALSGNNLNLVYSAVPEPGFLALLTGLATLFRVGCRRRTGVSDAVDVSLS